MRKKRKMVSECGQKLLSPWLEGLSFLENTSVKKGGLVCKSSLYWYQCLGHVEWITFSFTSPPSSVRNHI